MTLLLNHEIYLQMILEFSSSLELIQTLTLLSKFHHQYLHSKHHSNALIKRILRREFGVAITALKSAKPLTSNPLCMVRIMHNFWDDSVMGNDGNFMDRIMKHRDHWTFYALSYFLSRMSAKSSISVDLMSFDRSSQRVSVLSDHNEHILFLLFNDVLQSLYSNERASKPSKVDNDSDDDDEEDAKWQSEEPEEENEPWALLNASTMNSLFYRNVKPTEERLRRWAPKMEKYLETLHWMVMQHEYEFDGDDLWTFYYFYPFCCDRIKAKMLSILMNHEMNGGSSISTLFYPLQSVVDRIRSNLGADHMDNDFPRIWPKWSRMYTAYLIPDMVKCAVRSARLSDDSSSNSLNKRSTLWIDDLVEITDLIGPSKMLQLFLDMLCDDNVDGDDWTYYEAILFCILELTESESLSSSDNAKSLYIPQVLHHDTLHHEDDPQRIHYIAPFFVL